MANNEDDESGVISDIMFSAGQNDTDFSKVSQLLLNEDYKRRKTILENFQVAPITTISVIAQIYDIPFLKQWVDEFSEWRTSGDGGKGRQDIVDISKAAVTGWRDDERKGIIDRIRGRK